jgi:hypothetical protein
MKVNLANCTAMSFDEHGAIVPSGLTAPLIMPSIVKLLPVSLGTGLAKYREVALRAYEHGATQGTVQNWGHSDEVDKFLRKLIFQVTRNNSTYVHTQL